MDRIECDVWHGNKELFDFADSLVRKQDELTTIKEFHKKARQRQYPMHKVIFIDIVSEIYDMQKIIKNGGKYFSPAHKWMTNLLLSSKIQYREFLVGITIYKSEYHLWVKWNMRTPDNTIQVTDVYSAGVYMEKNGLPPWVKRLDETLIFSRCCDKELPQYSRCSETAYGKIYIPYLVVEPPLSLSMIYPLFLTSQGHSDGKN
jgi:hypothetical protein